ncbi:MAG TPA: cell wall hydrolase [Firmicutes bacterium]|nr:cell wall hydrolase [Bacillota bacterium]
MVKKQGLFLLLLFVLLAGVGSAIDTQKNIITGYVTCEESQLPLKSGVITLGEYQAPIREGRFHLEGIPPGMYEAVVDGTYRRPVREKVLVGLGIQEKNFVVPCEFNEEDVQLLARITHAEAEGESLEGKTAVAATVLNRVKNENYPDSIAGVVYQRVNGIYQYSPVADGRINLQPGQESKRAAYLALAGEDPTKGATGFYNPRKTGDRWVRQHPVTTAIGGHVFFRY